MLLTMVCERAIGGDVLWSDRSNPMLTIVADEVGRHDFLYSSCSLEMYRMQYGVTDGRLIIKPPKSRAGDSMLLRAEMDLAIVLTACPAPTCNGGGATGPIAFEILR